ncbi:MAG TPA: response regulator [Anaerolineaceae bacterium]|nr:response regulator [Anaerolineaceae bacterium]HPN52720.1 response regulator [Anaerolineaceae bacterium]
MAEKILVVDDDLETLRLVGLMLQRQGYAVISASNGAQAIMQAKTELPNIILLDVMMPDIDGYEVTRRLRSDADTAGIPILMFTAKGQVEDKVEGYEAGVDDYLTKPAHPAELAAHIKVLISRSSSKPGHTSNVQTAVKPVERCFVAAVLSAKGGVGASSLALNTSVCLHQRSKTNIIAIEMHPGQGNWGLELGYNQPEGLSRLLEMKPNMITQAALEKELVTHISGIRLIMSSYRSKDVELTRALPQFEGVISTSANMAQMVMLDIGNNIFPGIDPLFNLIDMAIIAVEPNPIAVMRTKTLLEDLSQKGFGKGSKGLAIIQINRVRADLQLSYNQVQESLGMPVNQVISPAPELAYQAALRFQPMIMLQPDGLASQQYGKVADLLAKNIRPRTL